MTWATSVPILVFLGLSVLELRPMYATDRRQTDRRQTKAPLNASALWGRRHNKAEAEANSECPDGWPHFHIPSSSRRMIDDNIDD